MDNSDSMSVTDPLLKELKGHIFELRRDSQAACITDRSSCLMPYCQILESILRKGLHLTSTTFGRLKRDYWNWIEAIPDHHKHRPQAVESAVMYTINEIKENSKVRTNQGRGRLFIRTALMKQILHPTLKFLINEKPWLKRTYNVDVSIVGHPVLSEILLSLILESQKILFSLKLFNVSFLDETWLLPIYKRYEFVPCKSLGINVCLKNHRAVVVNVEDGSVGGEEDQIEIGDILDELYGISFYDKKQRHLNSMMRQYSGLPVYVCIIKCHFQSGAVYPPIVSLLNELQIDMTELIKKFRQKEAALCQKFSMMQNSDVDSLMSEILGTTEDQQLSEQKIPTKGEDILFHGTFFVGEKGRVTEIEIGLNGILNSKKLNKPLKMVLRETELKLLDPKNGEIEFKHSFTEISSCGRRKDLPDYFAYIAGDTTCSISKSFTCYVFQADCAERAKLLLNCIDDIPSGQWEEPR